MAPLPLLDKSRFVYFVIVAVLVTLALVVCWPLMFSATDSVPFIVGAQAVAQMAALKGVLVEVAQTLNVSRADFASQLQQDKSKVCGPLAAQDLLLPPLGNPVNGTLCGLPQHELSSAWLQDHGNGGLGPGSHRYFVFNAWRDIGGVREAVEGQANVCLIVAAKNTMPCLVDECLFQLYVRPGTTDIDVLQGVVDRAEYDFMKEYEGITTVLDAGGNAGLASVLFAIRWPAARVVTVEPNSETYAQLVKNVGCFRTVTPVHAGLWSRNTKLVFGPNDIGAWGVNVQEADETSTQQQLEEGITSVSVPYLLDIFGLKAFDFCKIDIEGSEENVLSEEVNNDLSWVNATKVVSVEYHDWRNPGSVDKSFQYMHSHPLFSNRVYGEYWVFEKLQKAN